MTTPRDGSIERLLRQGLSADSAAPVGDCPDAETLAALAEHTLPAAARREVEGHLADCHRCQELTAAIARADSPVDATAGAADDVPTWRRRALNWLVPAAAAASAVALWVLVPGQREPASVEPASEQQITVASPPVLPPPTSEVITSEPLQLPVEGRADIAALQPDQNVAATAAAPQFSARVAAPPPVAAPAAPAPPAATPAEPALKAEAPVVGGVPAVAGERRSETPNETVAVQQDRLASLQARALIVTDVVSPDPRIRWRIVQGSAVQYSTDGGATWTTQQTGVPAALTAGSAPAPDVLWLVGRGGVVLRTTDRGRQWQRVPFPETVDLTAITATSARNATVVVADGRRFVTDDGGGTWIPVR